MSMTAKFRASPSEPAVLPITPVANLRLGPFAFA